MQVAFIQESEKIALENTNRLEPKINGNKYGDELQIVLAYWLPCLVII